MHLWMDFYLERPVLGSEQLEILHTLLVKTLPRWSAGLKVLKNADHQVGRNVALDFSLIEAINHEAPSQRELGSVVLKGSFEGLTLFLDTCQSTLPPELNCVSVEIDRATIEGTSSATWAYHFFQEAVGCLAIRYAKACLRKEFHAKNIISANTGVRAVGVNLDECLPGVYWLNFFGRPYTQLIGLDRLLSITAHEVRAIGEGVFVALNASPMAWKSDQYLATESSIIDQIGPEYVFSRTEPDRRKVAPKFRLATK